MPHPKNGIKLTGNTHLPDVGYDDGKEDELPLAAMAQDVVYADGYVPPAQMQMEMPDPELAEMPPEPTRLETVETKMAHAESRAPWLTIGMGVTLGYVLLRMLRRR